MREHTDYELVVVEKRLRGSRRLSEGWGITHRDYSEESICPVALVGVRGGYNTELRLFVFYLS